MVDGGFGDADGIENGVFIDPSGLGVPASVGAAVSSAGSSGSSSACFISTVNQNPGSIWPASILKRVRGIELAMILLGTIVLLCIRRIANRRLSEKIIGMDSYHNLYTLGPRIITD